MGLERNLFPNPACANNGTGWSSVSGSYARSTSVDAGLPRTTGWEGTVADDCNSPRAQVVAGQQYVYSVSICATAAQTFNMVVNFYDASSGGTFVGNSGTTVQVNLSAGQVQRFTFGPYTVPAGAVSSHIKFNDIDAGGCEITGIRCQLSTGNLTLDGEYFDGATTSPDADWDGTAGDSTSTRRVHRDNALAADSFGVVATALGPVFAETVSAPDAFSITASGTVADTGFAADGFLISQLEFDAARGRVRVSAFTFGPLVTKVRVRRRTIGGRLVDVRGGVVDVLGGLMIRPVDDYEYPAGVDVEYLIEGLTETDVVLQSAVIKRHAVGDMVWLKFVARPEQNVRVDLTGWGPISRDSRAEVFRVVGDQLPRVVTDVHDSRQVTIEIVTHTVDATEKLDDALSQGYPIYFQVPRGLQLPTLYASVGAYRFEPLKQSSQRSRFVLPLTEVAAPPASIIPGGSITYDTVRQAYTNYAALFEARSTYRELAIGG